MKRFLVVNEIYLASLIVLVSFTSCMQSDSCETLTRAVNYAEAVYTIKNGYFNNREVMNTARSSWIRGLEYIECDGKTGYLLLETDHDAYVYANVPREVWEDFKKAPSLGRFYNENIKHNYPFGF